MGRRRWWRWRGIEICRWGREVMTITSEETESKGRCQQLKLLRGMPNGAREIGRGEEGCAFGTSGKGWEHQALFETPIKVFSSGTIALCGVWASS